MRPLKPSCLMRFRLLWKIVANVWILFVHKIKMQACIYYYTNILNMKKNINFSESHRKKVINHIVLFYYPSKQQFIHACRQYDKILGILHFQLYSKMAFVYRKQKQPASTNPITPGPGQYNTNHTAPAPTNSVTTFSNKVPRKLWQQKQQAQTPGPCHYSPSNNNNKNDGFQTIFNNSKIGFYVVDTFNSVNNCSANFKSKSRRLDDHRSESPGPGHYEIAQCYEQRNNMGGLVWHKPSKLTKFLYEQNIKQCKGLPDTNSDTCLTKSNVNGIHHKQTNPNDENTNKQNKKQFTKHNYKSVFNSKVQRKVISRPQTSTGIGPGTYNTDQYYEKKVFNNNNNSNNNRTYENIGSIKAVNNNNQKQNIGPGCYQIQTSSFKRPQTSYSKGISCFGSRQTRFTHKKQKDIPGPQTYFKHSINKQTIQQIYQKQQKLSKKVGFNTCLSKQRKFNACIPSTTFTQISPCSYDPKNDFTCLLRRNYIKGTIGQFGSTVERFKSNNVQDESQPTKSQFQILTTENKNEQIMKQISGNKFKQIRKSNRKANESRVQKTLSHDERPLCYDSDWRTISSKYSKKKQLDAPFLVASERFREKRRNDEKQVFKYVKQQEQKSIQLRTQQSNKAKTGKICKGSQQNSIIKKFTQSAKQIKNFQNFALAQFQNDVVQLGPQTYNPQKMIKKSYNILFQN